MSFFFSAKIQQLVVNDSMDKKLETLLEQILSNRYGNDVEIEVKKKSARSTQWKIVGQNYFSSKL